MYGAHTASAYRQGQRDWLTVTPRDNPERKVNGAAKMLLLTPGRVCCTNARGSVIRMNEDVIRLCNQIKQWFKLLDHLHSPGCNHLTHAALQATGQRKGGSQPAPHDAKSLSLRTTTIQLDCPHFISGASSRARLLKNDVVHARHGRVTETGFDSCFTTCSCILTESLAFLRSCSSSSAADEAAAVGSIASFSKHADPREELFCWYVMSCDTGSLGLPHADSSGLLPVAPEAAPGGCSRDCTQAPLVPGAASPPKDASPSKAAGVEHRLGWDDENTRSSCFFFLLNIHNPDSFLLPSAPPVPRRSEPSLGLSHGLVFSWKFFHILRW